MKFGAKPSKIWHPAAELKGTFSRFSSQVNRLLILENAWLKEIGPKSKFWVLDAVQNNTILVKVPVLAARHELLLREKEIIKALNKYFDKPWIIKISIV